MAEQHLMKATRHQDRRDLHPGGARQPLDPKKLEEIAVSIADIRQQTPILVRPDKERYVLVSGLHRLEACRALGETTVLANIVQARKH